MTVQIEAKVEGESTSPTPVTDQNVVNGDFFIIRNRVTADRPGLETGDGADEETLWTFYYRDSSLLALSDVLEHAHLTLTLKPASNAIGGLNTDGFWIEMLPFIFLADALKNVFPNLTFDRAPDPDADPSQTTNRNIDSVLPLNQATTITFDLLNHYRSEDILSILFNSSPFQDRITMRYSDDALISFARLELIRKEPT
jgi:hypothetical protein